MSRGYLRALDLMEPMTAWSQEHEEPPPTIATIRDDMRRSRILAAEAAQDESLNVVYSMAAVEREAWHRATDEALAPDSRTKREYLELAGRMVEARDRHEHRGIEAALAERGMELAEKYAEIMLTVVVDVLSSAPIDRSTQMWIRNKIADELQAKVIDARPAARLES
jgi:hypothetical protein